MFDEAYEDLEEAFIRLPGDRDSDDILLLPSYQQYIDTIDTIIFGERVDRVDRVSLHHHSNSHEDPSFMASTPNANPSEFQGVCCLCLSLYVMVNRSLLVVCLDDLWHRMTGIRFSLPIMFSDSICICVCLSIYTQFQNYVWHPVSEIFWGLSWNQNFLLFLRRKSRMKNCWLTCDCVFEGMNVM